MSFSNPSNRPVRILSGLGSRYISELLSQHGRTAIVWSLLYERRLQVIYIICHQFHFLNPHHASFRAAVGQPAITKEYVKPASALPADLSEVMSESFVLPAILLFKAQ